jgi:two-component system chemotaxis response regulator CheB
MPSARFITVLLVEPDPLARDLARLALQGLRPDTVVLTAADGVEALDQVRALKPQVALVNLLLPRLSGLETIRQLRSRLGMACPILAMSALGWREVVQQAIAAGACDFVVRPCDSARLVEKVRRVLAQAQAAAGAAVTASHCSTFTPRTATLQL